MRRAVEVITPKVLLDLYSALSDENQNAFLKLLGSISTAESPLVIVSQLDRLETFRFSQMLTAEFVKRTLPIVLRQARLVAKNHPGVSDTDFDSMVNERVKVELETMSDKLSELEAEKLKAKRDRKSDPVTIKRYVEICNLRRGNKSKWTQGALAKRFEVTPAMIRQILREETKWRQLEARLSSN